MRSLFLDAMVRSSRTRLEAARSIANLEVQRRRAELVPTRALPSGFQVFAEIKPESPADGRLGDDDPVGRARRYAEGGATAISVLTEPTRFGGSLELLEEVASAVDRPVMRKDFVVDPYQVWEGRAHGASGILAIARILDPDGLTAIVDAARDAEMFVLIEAFDRSDLDVVSGVESGGHVLVGVNSRDLDSLQVRAGAHSELAGHLPEGVPAIAESGIAGPERVPELVQMGYRGVLMGTTLMRSADPAETVAAIVAAGAGAA